MKTDTAVLPDIIGKIPWNEPLFRKRASILQTWWHMNVLNGDYKFAYSGLFCYPFERLALIIADPFKDFFRDPNEFKTITYTDFISKIMTFKHLQKPEVVE